jgi:hypothetical protein
VDYYLAGLFLLFSVFLKMECGLFLRFSLYFWTDWLGFKEARKQEVLKEIPPKRTNKIPQQQKTI